ASIGAPGPHDFTVRVGVARPARKCGSRKSPCHHSRARTTAASIASLSSVRDDAYAPHQDRNANTIRLMLVRHEAIYFSREDWTGRFGLMRLGNFDFSRRKIWDTKFLARCDLALR